MVASAPWLLQTASLSSLEAQAITRAPSALLISIAAIVLIWIIAIPIAIYSATRQYSVLDYVFTFFGFLGLSIPNFLLALVLMWVVYATTGRAITGLISREFLDQPWSLAKIIDLLQNVWLPLIIIATAGMASLIRIMRATLLDELRKQYVTVARAKGLSEFAVLMRYPVRIAINLSPVQFVQGDLVREVVRALEDTGLQPACLELEITEGILMRDTEAAVATLRRLHALGVVLAVDDFGTGYSSLSYLRHIHVDALKIDRSFVAGLADDPQDAAIVGAIVGLAHALGVAAIAEGVESAKQVEQARLLGCDVAQGYYFAHPQPADTLGELWLLSSELKFAAGAEQTRIVRPRPR
jgi:EAL domain-containing protein (putative c-di-GMP-specific phosphodiesterase class I)